MLWEREIASKTHSDSTARISKQQKTKAALISGELAQDLGWDDFAVLVIDEYGKEVLRHPIDR
jgi:hypothetical protein